MEVLATGEEVVDLRGGERVVGYVVVLRGGRVRRGGGRLGRGTRVEGGGEGEEGVSGGFSSGCLGVSGVITSGEVSGDFSGGAPGNFSGVVSCSFSFGVFSAGCLGSFST